MPVIAKADTLTGEECQKFKQRVSRGFTELYVYTLIDHQVVNFMLRSLT